MAARGEAGRVGRLTARWSLLALLLLPMLVLLAVQGLSTRTTGRSATPRASRDAPPAARPRDVLRRRQPGRAPSGRRPPPRGARFRGRKPHVHPRGPRLAPR